MENMGYLHWENYEHLTFCGLVTPVAPFTNMV